MTRDNFQCGNFIKADGKTENACPSICASSDFPSEGEKKHLLELYHSENYVSTQKFARNFVKKFPNTAFGWKILSAALYQTFQHNEALDCAKNALLIDKSDPETHYSIGAIYLETGLTQKARDHYNQAIKLSPYFIEAYSQLAQLHKFSVDDPLLKILEKFLQEKSYSESQELALYIALTKAYSDIGEIQKSLDCILNANALQKAATKYESKTDISLFNKIIALDEANPVITINKPKSATQPIFIVGMPRSGTTLVEQIISNNPEITPGGELLFLAQCFKNFCRLSGFNKLALEKSRNFYLKHIQGVSNRTRFVTDKTPQNFILIGLIIRALPDAKIIHVKRDPQDVCWSNLKTIFKTGDLPYSNHIDDIVTYHNLYTEVMSHWYEKYPDKIYTIKYESLINNFQDEVASLSSHLGLSWCDSYSDFQANAHPVRTASITQVRKKIYNSSGQWQPYAAYLTEPFMRLITSKSIP